jgi:NAD(P)H-dependent FMN reductase
VAERVKERLAAPEGGHTVTLLRLETVGPATVSGEKDELRTRPAVDQYDAVVFACPVRGGAPPPPMATYLSGIPSLLGKQVALVVTGFFPAGVGTNQTLAAMKEACAAKGATVCAAGGVWWFGPVRKRQMARVVEEVAGCFGP